MLEEPDAALYGLYSEGVEQVLFDPSALRQYAQSIRKIPEYKDFHYLGYIHTHLNGIAYPSPQDLEAAAFEYENNMATSRVPRIFGIAWYVPDGEDEYFLYRIVHVGSGYGFKQLDHPDIA